MTDEKKGRREQGDGAHGYGFVGLQKFPGMRALFQELPSNNLSHQKEINTLPFEI